MTAPTLLSAAPVQQSTAASAKSTSVIVSISNLRNEDGVIRACLTPNSKGFPKRCDSDANAVKLVVKAKSGTVLTFKDVKPGTYAIALLHDENDNGKADRALSMIPKEGFGFSRDAKVVMSPPKFAKAAFEVAGSPVRQTIRMRYML